MDLKGWHRKCVGRDALVSDVLRKSLVSRCVLLFAGKGSGCTRVLLEAERVGDIEFRNAGRYGAFVLVVYVDLMAMNYDAGPPDFFRYLVRLAGRRLDLVLGGRDPIRPPNPLQDVDYDQGAFVQDINALLDATSSIDGVLFLLDDGARVLSRRFPRAFQDNIFSMLYGSHVHDERQRRTISLLFAAVRSYRVFRKTVPLLWVAERRSSS